MGPVPSCPPRRPPCWLCLSCPSSIPTQGLSRLVHPCSRRTWLWLQATGQTRARSPQGLSPECTGDRGPQHLPHSCPDILFSQVPQTLASPPTPVCSFLQAPVGSGPRPSKPRPMPTLHHSPKLLPACCSLFNHRSVFLHPPSSHGPQARHLVPCDWQLGRGWSGPSLPPGLC